MIKITLLKIYEARQSFISNSIINVCVKIYEFFLNQYLYFYFSNFNYFTRYLCTINMTLIMMIRK